MSIKQWQNEITKNLEDILQENLPDHYLKEVINYSVLPPGKLFRPLLVYSLASDINGVSKEHQTLACAIELHHTYTLIHDDLPAMDNDDLRRGRPSSHIKFNQWSAILAGDALLNLSYELLANLSPTCLPAVLKDFSLSCGAQGLVLGQCMDLANENDTLKKLLKIHELKTARLIQTSLSCSAFISQRNDMEVKLKEIGYALGIVFQLLDDLCELIEDVNQHEKEINPFLHFKTEELTQLINTNCQIIFSHTQEYKLINLMNYIQSYLTKINQKLLKNKEKIVQKIDIKINQLNLQK